MTIRVPTNVSSMTFTTSGVKVPASRLISGLTAVEETALAAPGNHANGIYIISTNLGSGAGTVKFPAGILTTLTINGNVTAVNAAGVSASVVAVDLTAFMGAADTQPFQIGAG